LTHFFGWLLQQGVLNKDSSAWLEGAQHANTCILPYPLRNVPAKPRGIPIPKIHLQVLKNVPKIMKSLFIFKTKIRESLTNSLLATESSPNVNFYGFPSPTNSPPMFILTFHHRDKTRVQMPAKIFPHLKVKC
jgi:hypothetical protein